VHDEGLRYVLAYGIHDAPGAGHLGREKTYALLNHHFLWFKTYKWVSRYVHSCKICQRVKPGLHSQAPLHSLSVPGDCWKSINLDFFFNLPPTATGCLSSLIDSPRWSIL
jgi:hypothetical protein